MYGIPSANKDVCLEKYSFDEAQSPSHSTCSASARTRWEDIYLAVPKVYLGI